MEFKTIFLSILFLPISCIAVIHKIDVLEKDDQRIYLMSDFHPKNDQDEKQVFDTINAINQLKAFTICENACELIEGSYLWRPSNCFVYQFHKNYLKSCSMKRKYNMEFRMQHRFFDQFSSYKVVHILKETEAQLKEIEKYNDNIILNEFYKFIIQDVRKRMSIFDKYKNYNKLAYDKDKALQKKVKIQLNEILPSETPDIDIVINYYIMEAKAIHEIYNNKNNNIFIVAGGAHNITLEDMLTNLLGYKKTESYGEPYRDSYGNVTESIVDTLDIKKCFGKINQTQQLKKIHSKL